MTTEVDILTFTDCDFLQVVPSTIGSLAAANSFHMQIRSIPTDPTVWVDLNSLQVPNPLMRTAGSPDTITINIPQSKLNKMPPGQYVYSVIMVSSGGLVRTEVFRGIITHSAGPTQFAAGTV